MFLKKTNSLKFTDDSCVEFVDRETVKYREGDYSVLVWVDYYKVRFLSYGRVVNIDRVEKWDTFPDGATPNIDSIKRNEIFTKIESYCKSKGWPVKRRVTYTKGVKP
jgi:hypothetical protein